MRLPRILADRRVTSMVRRALFDGILPPFVRDARPLNAVINKMWLGDVPLEFQRIAWKLGPEDWARIWNAIGRAATSTSRDGDTSEAETSWVVDRIRALAPTSVLEIGAGRGQVAARVAAVMPASSHLHLLDPFADVKTPTDGPEIHLLRADAKKLPFADKELDVVICLHTLEHLTHLVSTFAEIRRVSRRSLVIVPLQRWAPFTWDLHLHFFPYLEYLPGLLEVTATSMQVIDGDGCYDLSHP